MIEKGDMGHEHNTQLRRRPDMPCGHIRVNLRSLTPNRFVHETELLRNAARLHNYIYIRHFA